MFRSPSTQSVRNRSIMPAAAGINRFPGSRASPPARLRQARRRRRSAAAAPRSPAPAASRRPRIRQPRRRRGLGARRPRPHVCGRRGVGGEARPPPVASRRAGETPGARAARRARLADSCAGRRRAGRDARGPGPRLRRGCASPEDRAEGADFLGARASPPARSRKPRCWRGGAPTAPAPERPGSHNPRHNRQIAPPRKPPQGRTMVLSRTPPQIALISA